LAERGPCSAGAQGPGLASLCLKTALRPRQWIGYRASGSRGFWLVRSSG